MSLKIIMYGPLKDHKLYSRLNTVKKFINILGVKPIHIILPVILSFLVVFLNGISLILLIPLARGIITNDVSFVSSTPILHNIISIFPRFKHLINIDLSAHQSIFLSFINIILFIVILKNIISYINNLFSDYWNKKFIQNMDRFIFNKFIGFGKLFFDNTNKGYITLVLSYSKIIIRLLNLFQDSIIVVLSILANITIMIIISWKLTIVTFLVFPFSYFSLKLIINQLGKLATQKNKVQIELNESIINIFSCIPLVKAYSKEKETEEKYSNIQERLRRLDFRADKISNLIQPIQEIIITGILLLTMSIMVLFFARGDPARISALAIFFYVARTTLPGFNITIRINNAVKQMKPQLKELLRNLDDRNKFFVRSGNKIFNGLTKSIDFCHLNFSYIEGVDILKDVSFNIEKGKTTAIVGATGAGKTTLINLIIRFYDCPASSIMIDDTDIRDFTLESLRSHMSLVSQEAWLFNDTLRNNVIFGLDKEITDDLLIDVAKKSRLYDLIMQLPQGFDTKVGDRGVKLSGGEKQRVSIARSLLKDSEILILDEATSSLDSQTERLIQEAIDQAIKERTVIVIAHRLSTIKKADKIIVLENGCLAEQGGLKDLIERKSAFYKYWVAQRFY